MKGIKAAGKKNQDSSAALMASLANLLFITKKLNHDCKERKTMSQEEDGKEKKKELNACLKKNC